MKKNPWEEVVAWALFLVSIFVAVENEQEAIWLAVVALAFLIDAKL